MSTLTLTQFDLNQIIIEETRRLLEGKDFIKRSTRSVVYERDTMDTFGDVLPRGSASSGVGGEAFLDIVQLVLGGLGFIEGPGMIADLLNSGISFSRGLCIEGMFDLISALPLAGILAGLPGTALKATKISLKSVTGWTPAARRALELMKKYIQTVFSNKEALKGIAGEMTKIMALDERVIKASIAFPKKVDNLASAKLRKAITKTPEFKQKMRKKLAEKRAEMMKARADKGGFQKGTPDRSEFVLPKSVTTSLQKEVSDDVFRTYSKYTGPGKEDLTQAQREFAKSVRSEAFNEAYNKEPILSRFNPLKAPSEKELQEQLDSFFRVQGIRTEAPAGSFVAGAREANKKIKKYGQYIKIGLKFVLALERMYKVIMNFLGSAIEETNSYMEVWERMNGAFCFMMRLDVAGGLEYFKDSEPAGGNEQEQAPKGTPAGDSEEDPQPTGITRQKSFGSKG